jgi:hypothetical protein
MRSLVFGLILVATTLAGCSGGCIGIAGISIGCS